MWLSLAKLSCQLGFGCTVYIYDLFQAASLFSRGWVGLLGGGGWGWVGVVIIKLKANLSSTGTGLANWN